MKAKEQKIKSLTLFEGTILRQAVVDAFVKLNPLHMMRRPVMFVVEAGSVLTSMLFLHSLFGQAEESPGFILAVSIWLWFTVLFGNFAEAMAEGRGKAQARALRSSRRDVSAKRLTGPDPGAERTLVAGSQLHRGDFVLVEAGDVIPGDGEVVVGIASVDESAITGESAPVIRESGGDRSAVTGGTRVLSDWLIVRVTSNPGETFLDRMIAMVEGAKRQKTPNEIALDIFLAGLTIIFLLATVTLLPFSIFSVQAAGQGSPVTVTVLVALLVCLIPTTIGGLLSAIGIAGMDRMIQANVIAMSRPCRRGGRRRGCAAARQDGDHHPRQPAGDGISSRRRRGRCRTLPMRPSLPPWPTRRPRAAASSCWPRRNTACGSGISRNSAPRFIPFTAQTRMSGVDLDGRQIRKGAADAIEAYVTEQGGSFPAEIRSMRRTTSHTAAAHRWSWPTGPVLSASST